MLSPTHRDHRFIGKFQAPISKEYPIFKCKPSARGLNGEPPSRIALEVGTWNFRDVQRRGWLNILYSGAVELGKISRV